jgi:hypothetical protein
MSRQPTNFRHHQLELYPGTVAVPAHNFPRCAAAQAACAGDQVFFHRHVVRHAAMFEHQALEVEAHGVCGGIPENPFCRGIEGFDDAVAIYRDKRVRHVVHDQGHALFLVFQLLVGVAAVRDLLPQATLENQAQDSGRHDQQRGHHHYRRQCFATEARRRGHR